jgi:hypothetical protein
MLIGLCACVCVCSILLYIMVCVLVGGGGCSDSDNDMDIIVFSYLVRNKIDDPRTQNLISTGRLADSPVKGFFHL